ncbi:MAG: DUF2341 domain-containing protein, partial [Methanophagales archaeon]|nr:DUF2341 domain-containing protein [Methanophagales archaeon]
NTDLGFFAANNWWNYNVSSFVDNVRLRKCTGAEREPFVDFGLADVTISNISSRYRSRYANFPNQILVNVTNKGTADARNFLVALYARDNDNDNDNVSGVSEPQEIANKTITVPHKSSRIVEFIWTPPKEGNYTLIVKADEKNIVDELNETNNIMSWDVCVNALKYWGFAFMKNVSLKPFFAIKNATVLLTLDPSIFDYAKVNPDGSDLRIKNDKGEDLPYWIEEWNTSGISRIWFKTDSNSGVVHLCYGNCTVNHRNETIIASFFEDWESQARSAELYRELSMNVSNAFFCADARADSVSYIIDVNVSGKIYHLWYNLSNQLPEDTDDTLYFAFYPKPEGHVWHIHRNLREDLRSKGIEVPEFFNITRIALRVRSTGYFAIFGMNHPVVCANIGKPELNVSVKNATFYANATSDMRVLVENTGEADANVTVRMTIYDEDVSVVVFDDVRGGEVPHRSSRTFSFRWTPPHAGSYSLSVSLFQLQNESKRISKRIHVNPDLKWQYNTTVKINVRGDDLSDVAVPIELSPDVYNRSLEDGSDIRVFRGEEEVPFWVAWFSPNGSVLFTNVSVPCTLHVFYGCSACADVLSPSNASTVASFYEDWSNYIEYGEHTHFYGWSNPRLRSADG